MGFYTSKFDALTSGPLLTLLTSSIGGIPLRIMFKINFHYYTGYVQGIYPEFRVVHVRDNITIVCNSETFPVWFHNFHLINDRRARISPGRFELIGATLGDTGQYSCRHPQGLHFVDLAARVVVICKWLGKS